MCIWSYPYVNLHIMNKKIIIKLLFLLFADNNLQVSICSYPCVEWERHCEKLRA